MENILTGDESTQASIKGKRVSLYTSVSHQSQMQRCWGNWGGSLSGELQELPGVCEDKALHLMGGSGASYPAPSPGFNWNHQEAAQQKSFSFASILEECRPLVFHRGYVCEGSSRYSHTPQEAQPQLSNPHPTIGSRRSALL